MRRRLFNLVAMCSLLVAAALVPLSFAKGSDPHKQHLNLCGWCYIGVNGEGPDATVYIFDEGVLYFGLYPVNFGDPKSYEVKGPGIGYWHLRWRDGTSHWTIRLSILYPLIAALLLPAFWLIRRRRRHGRGFPVDAQAAAG